MKDLSEHILHILHKQHICEDWIKKGYKEKPIVIIGGKGCGKTRLAEYILRDFTKIYIHSEHSRNISNLTEYLNDSLYKKSITMLFKNHNQYKSIIFDDLEYIKDTDKSLFKSILTFSKDSHREHPIIYILSSIDHKEYKELYNRCFPISIDLSLEQIYMIVRKYFIHDKKHLSYIKQIVKQCHSNFHSIQSNIALHTKKETIQSYEIKEDNPLLFMNQLLQTTQIDDIFRRCSYDYTIISLNLLENCSLFIEKTSLSSNEKVNLLHNLYSNTCLCDHLNQLYLSYYGWDYDTIYMFFGIVLPLFSIRGFNPIITNFQYTKVISKCIIYTHHSKLMEENSLKVQDLFILFYMIRMNYPFKIIRSYIQEIHLTKKIIIKFMKYYESLYNYKIPKIMIKKLL